MKNYLLAILSGILFSISWPIDGFIFFIFFGFVPLLFLAEKLINSNSSIKFFSYSFVSFIIFNIYTTSWIYYASPFGAISAILANSFFMALVMMLYFYSKKALKKRLSYFSLIIFWLTFEYVHLNWDLSWPWLTLGNSFSESLYLINWYEYTGVLGGSFWIILLNILFFLVLFLFYF